MTIIIIITIFFSLSLLFFTTSTITAADNHHHHHQIISRFQQYLQINTAHPNPNYYQAADFIISQANSLHLESQTLEFVKGKPLILLKWSGKNPNLPSILLNSHTDVVPVESHKWKHPPFEAHLDQSSGNIFARGSQDMKCVGLQYLEAIRRLKKSGFEPIRNLYISFVPDEEIGGHDGAEKFAESEIFNKMNVGIVLDEGLASTDEKYRVFYAERSPWWLVIKAIGAPGHGAKLYDNTAMENLLKSIESVRRFRASQFDIVKSGLKAEGEVISVNMVFLKAGTPTPTGFVMNLQPSEAEAGFDIRIPPTADPKSLETRISEEWAPSSRNMTFEFKQKEPVQDKYGKAVLTATDKSNPWWALLEGAVLEANGKFGKAEIFPASTDARFFRILGLPAIGFSPIANTPILLHDHNEFLNQEEYIKGIEMYESIIKAYTSYLEPTVDETSSSASSRDEFFNNGGGLVGVEARRGLTTTAQAATGSGGGGKGGSSSQNNNTSKQGGGNGQTNFNVKNFGARADGRNDDTQAFTSAWKGACASAGVGMVTITIPKGTYMVGPIKFTGPCKSPITIEMQGFLKGTSDLSRYDGSSSDWIEFGWVDGLTLTGGGTFDGQGSSSWPFNKCPTSQNCKLLPTNVKFVSTTNTKVRGITSLNSKFFHIVLLDCKDFHGSDIKISAPANSPNTDGIHIERSKGVTISNSVIGTGDDCISIGQGNAQVTITGITCGPGHGISVGSLGKYPNEGDVNGLVVKSCTLSGTMNGIRIKTWANSPDSSVASNMTFEDIVVNNVANPIIIDQTYCPFASCSSQAPSRVKLSDIYFKNIRGTTTSPVAVTLECSKGVPCQNVNLHDVHLDPVGGGTVAKSSCQYVKAKYTGTQIPPPCA